MNVSLLYFTMFTTCSNQQSQKKCASIFLANCKTNDQQFFSSDSHASFFLFLFNFSDLSDQNIFFAL